jgi:four helix bundle protein
MASESFENLRVYRAAEDLSDAVWDIVVGWGSFPKDTIGKQLVRAADSIGANIAEGAGRGSYLDNKRFVKIARGSLYETKHFLRRAHKRKLLSAAQIKQLQELIKALPPMLNAYLKSIGATAGAKDE